MPNRAGRATETLIVLLAVAAIGGLAYEFWPESPAYAIDQPARVIDGLPAGETHHYVYRITNRTNRPIRVVGAEFT